MKSKYFEEQVLINIKKRLSSKSASLQDLAILAQEALRISESHPDDIPQDVILGFLKKHPEQSLLLRGIVEEDDSEREGKISALKSKLQKS